MFSSRTPAAKREKRRKRKNLAIIALLSDIAMMRPPQPLIVVLTSGIFHGDGGPRFNP
jgi:hypothetical protein